jgi:hypothetical protein
MDGMKYGAYVGWGIVIYAVMFLLWSGFVTYGFAGNIVSRVAGLIVLISIATIAGRALRLPRWQDILPYSLAWGVVVGLLDMALSVPFGGWEIYADWNIWVGYLLVVVVPLFAPMTRRVVGQPL